MLVRAAVLSAYSAFLCIACSTEVDPVRGAAPSRIVVAGSSTIQPVMDIVAQKFEAAHAGAHVDVQGGGSSVGITAPRTGLAQIGMVSRALKPDEQDLTHYLIAHDGIAIIAHQSNPIRGLTKDEVVKVYTGGVANWQDLGGTGRDAPITVINKEEGRSTLELFEKHFDLKDKFVKNAVIIGPNGQAIATVAGNPDSIAYVSIGTAEVAVKQGTPIKILTLDGVDATTENVRNRTYPLMRALNLTTKGPATGAVKEVIDYVLSPDGQAVVVDQGFVPLQGAAPAPKEAPAP